jgi:hypothetical protein
MAVDIETRSADVSVDGFDAPGPERTIGMIWRRSNPLAEQLREMSDLVRQAATGLGLAEFFLREGGEAGNILRRRRNTGEPLQIPRHARHPAIQRFPLIERVGSPTVENTICAPGCRPPPSIISVSCKHRRAIASSRAASAASTRARRPSVAPRPFPDREIETRIEQVRVDETLEEVAHRPRDRRRRPRTAISSTGARCCAPPTRPEARRAGPGDFRNTSRRTTATRPTAAPSATIFTSPTPSLIKHLAGRVQPVLSRVTLALGLTAILSISSPAARRPRSSAWR